MSFANNHSGVEFDTENLTPICNTTKQFGNRLTISILRNSKKIIILMIVVTY